jgi:amidase
MLSSRVQTLARQRPLRFSFSPDAEPAVCLQPGERLCVELWDCFGNYITSPAQRFASLAELLELTGGLNPLSGPIFVDGAQPGDVLAVHIDAIRLATVAPEAVTVIVPGVGGVCAPSGRPVTLSPTTWICPIHAAAGYVVLPLLAGEVRLPLRPMLGTIGTAPAQGQLSSLEFSPECCGNVDSPDIGVGSTVLLPVNVPGALLSIGDLHAAMGDAEITGTALETSGDVVLRCEVLSRTQAGYFGYPQIATPDEVGSIGAHFGCSLDTNVKCAMSDLAARLVSDHRLSEPEAYAVLGAAARVRVHQCVDGGWTAASAFISRDLLRQLGS